MFIVAMNHILRRGWQSLPFISDSNLIPEESQNPSSYADLGLDGWLASFEEAVGWDLAHDDVIGRIDSPRGPHHDLLAVEFVDNRLSISRANEVGSLDRTWYRAPFQCPSKGEIIQPKSLPPPNSLRLPDSARVKSLVHSEGSRVRKQCLAQVTLGRLKHRNHHSRRLRQSRPPLPLRFDNPDPRLRLTQEQGKHLLRGWYVLLSQ